MRIKLIRNCLYIRSNTAVLKYKTHLHVLKRENSRRLSGYTQKGHTCIIYLGAACKELISSYRNLGPSKHGLVTEIRVNVYWKYAEAELSKLTYVEDQIIISPFFIFSPKSNA